MWVTNVNEKNSDTEYGKRKVASKKIVKNKKNQETKNKKQKTKTKTEKINLGSNWCGASLASGD